MKRYCFITGFLRSGTTLVEKLVHALPGACIGPQPFPFLYYDAKRAFLRTLGSGEERYPLGHLLREDRYGPDDFGNFLAGYRLTREAVAASFDGMRGYGGWRLPAMAACAAQVGEGSFAHVYRQLCDALQGIFGRERSRVLGAKEVFCEEFIPYFLSENVSVILVVRDVRDVLASLKAGSGAAYANRGLAVLHIVRQWRKSVAFALQFSGAAGFELVRYEALVAGARPWLGRLAQQLGCPPAPADALDDLRDQEGRSWQGNSSFAPVTGVSRGSVGRFAGSLPRALVEAVESLCAPEMSAIGLAARGGDDRELAAALERAAQETDLVGPGESLAAEIDAERRRARVISSGHAPLEEQRYWCIFPRAYQALCAAT